MLRILLVILVFMISAADVFSQTPKNEHQLPQICLSPAEMELYTLINEYRSRKGLPEIKLSASLCYVAQTHAKDQDANFKQGASCNMHSWSDKGNWIACCYTPDHKKASCMWSKPRELTGYTGDGFEISFWSTYKYPNALAQAKDILDGWKKSPGHNDVIINKKEWKDVSWQAIGIGIYGEYANVWFGIGEDTANMPEPCGGE